MCEFKNSESWVILSPIELSIKRKIESIGTPLKDWDIQINYGIKTGFNDAFIITTEKRKEILDNCITQEEREKTEELIRPILRGRDIKRYGYDWAELWLIATFPSRHYDIEKYPSVKKYLLSFGIERLEQTGKTHVVRGETIKSRKKTNNKWFETQDSISYWEDFYKPKIMYAEIVREPQFFIDNNGSFFPEATTFILTGKDIEYICKFLNSNIVALFFRLFYAGGGLGETGVRYKKLFIEKIPIPPLNIQNVNDDMFKLYHLNDEQIKYIKSII